jgi:hypothetical protein
MAKESGMGWTTMSVADSAASLKDIKNDITNFQFATPRAVQDVTGIDKSAFERILLLSDLSFTWNGVFDDATNLAHDVFKTVSSSSVARAFSLVISGQTLGTTNSPTVLLTDYNLTRPQDGSFTWSVPGVLANGGIPAWS